MVHSVRRSQSGQVLVLVAIMMIVLVGMAMLAVDVGRGQADRRQLQQVSDSAALAAARQYTLSWDFNQAHWVGLQYLAASLGIALPGGCTQTSCGPGPWVVSGYTFTFTDTSATGSVDLSISHTLPTAFTRAVGVSSIQVGASGRARLDPIPMVLPCALCFLGNGPVQRQLYLTADGGVNVHGGNISMNSTATTNSVERSGNGQVSVDPGSAFQVAGNPPTAAGTCIGCAPGFPTYAPAITDPLIHMPQPPSCPVPGCPTGPAVAGPTSGAANPGVYTTIGGAGALTLNPGTYIITGNMSLGDGITGTGVTLIFVCSSYPTPCASGGQTGATLSGGNGDLNISAPTSGQPYNGMAIMFDRNNCGPSCTATDGGPYAMSLSSNGGLTITGTVYAPMASINTSGNGGYTFNGAVIARSAELQANGAINLTYNPAQNIQPVRQGNGLIR